MFYGFAKYTDKVKVVRMAAFITPDIVDSVES